MKMLHKSGPSIEPFATPSIEPFGTSTGIFFEELNKFINTNPLLSITLVAFQVWEWVESLENHQ